jgi:hypothetical protein
MLQLRLPADSVGKRYPLTITITTTDEDSDMTNNTATSELAATSQTFLPIISR